MNKYSFSLWLVVVMAAVGVAQGGGGVRKAIQFAKGTSSATLGGGVVRGDSDWYDLTAKAGQTMEVHITSLENNAVFRIYRPGFKVMKEDGMAVALPSFTCAVARHSMRGCAGSDLELPVFGRA